jgi:hypothetical protein
MNTIIVTVFAAGIGMVILYLLLFKVSIEKTGNIDDYPELTELQDGSVVQFIKVQEHNEILTLLLITKEELGGAVVQDVQEEHFPRRKSSKMRPT